MLHVAFLWHHHQPFYKDLLTGESRLPWVRLHGIKDYYGMAALVDEFPEARITFNLVPSLLSQIHDYARGGMVDRNLVLSTRRAQDLDEHEVEFLRRNFFRCHRPTMIDPHPRYRELYFTLAWDPKGGARNQRAVPVGDLRDLQVWSTLTWFHTTLQAADPVISELSRKGRHYTEEDKTALFSRQAEILESVIPQYRRLQDQGRIEISTSPFYHPILPLLLDMESAREAQPSVNLPRHRGPYGNDAFEQLSRACRQYESFFGLRPRGLWPSEGAVSEDLLPLLTEMAFKWFATDEGILHRSKRSPGTEGSVHRNTPYGHEGFPRGPLAYFRDRTLSDLIGFTYYNWDPLRAADDLISRLKDMERSGKDGDVVSIILDGENPWEAYPGGGVTFLREVYRRIEGEKDLAFTTFEQDLPRRSDPPRLSRLAAGSWIRSDFGIWIGGDEDNHAWDLLGRTRQFLRARGESQDPRAREALLAAEGSDWFWWYGDDFACDEDDLFDLLFRQNLAHVHRFLDAPVPPYLEEPICQRLKLIYTLPTGFSELTLDGKVTHYVEWSAAGRYRPSGGAQPMGRSDGRRVRSVLLGFSLTELLIRIDLNGPAREVVRSDGGVAVLFLPGGERLSWEAAYGRAEWIGTDGESRFLRDPAVAVDDIVEMACPFALLGAVPGGEVRCAVEILEKDAAVERHPPIGTFTLTVPTKDFEKRNWQV